VQQYDDSRSQSLGIATTDPEQAQQNAAVLDAPAETAGATASAGPQAAPTAAEPTTQVMGAPAPTNASFNGIDSEDLDDDDGLTMAALLDNPNNAMRELQRGDVVEGTVARVDADEVLVDIGQKSEGVISNREMGSVGDTGLLHVGQKLLVYVVQPESAEGHATLSLKRARMEQSWRDAEQWMAEDRVIEAPVIDFNKGGLIVEVGVRGFVPISQISELRGLAKGPDSGDSPQVAERLAAMRGRTLKLKIIELNRARNRLILSERLAMQEERAGRKEALLHELEPGQIRTGRVTSLAAFGAFVDLGGADGLVHISQISYSRVSHPSEVLKVGDEVKVYVLSIDPQTKKIALSLKKAQPDPWTLVEERYQVGDVVEGTITKLAKFGAFARIDDGIEGLIHLSELADGPVEKPQDVVSEGQEVKLRVIAINSQRRRLGLSLRQAQGDTLRPVEVPAEFDDDLDGDDESPRTPRARAPEPAPAAPVQTAASTATINNTDGRESPTTPPPAPEIALGGVPPEASTAAAATDAPALDAAPAPGDVQEATPTDSSTPTVGTTDQADQGVQAQDTSVPGDNGPQSA
jgi:small subunit ribosomal protein S1